MTEAIADRKPRRFARELTALVGAPLLIAIIILGPDWSYIAFIAITSSLALWEFLTLGEKKGYPVQKVLSIALSLLILAAFVFPQLRLEVAIFAVLLILPGAYVFSRRGVEGALPGSAVCVLATLYVGMLAGAVLSLRLDFESGWKLVLFLMVTVWAGDAGAYYVGRAFGKTRLSPRVSPKKTVEGGIGGVLTSMAVGALISLTFFREMPVVHAIIAGAILSVAGVIGDLAESLWKRSADVKDSGTLIPGHGGFLDRTDSILYTAPILYGYWWLLQNDWRL